MEISDKIRKNLLDLQHTKYIQYFNTCVILLFTYFIGLVISFFTKQIDYSNREQVILIIFTSVVFFVIMGTLLIKFNLRVKSIMREVTQLRL